MSQDGLGDPISAPDRRIPFLRAGSPNETDLSLNKNTTRTFQKAQLAHVKKVYD